MKLGGIIINHTELCSDEIGLLFECVLEVEHDHALKVTNEIPVEIA